MLSLTPKQKEFWNGCNHRWNIKCGATRSGKTFLDYYIIPRRIRAVSGLDGLYMILGNTQMTIQRNIIEPLQKIYGAELVSDIKSNNTAYMFGEKVYCIGADKKSQMERLRGSSIKYCYGDEVVTWNEDVFSMLKSRLDKSYSRFDGTCNPEGPEHWFKKFIDSDADIFYQQYTLYDNPFLTPEFVRNLELEYRNSVYFDRYIMGMWQRAEGLVYPLFCDNEDDYYITAEEVPDDIRPICVGQDFGGNKSKHTYCASAVSRDGNTLYVLASDEDNATGTNVEYICNGLKTFMIRVEGVYGRPVSTVYADSAEQAIINTERGRFGFMIRNSIKNEVIDRIRCTDLLLSTNRIKIVKEHNKSLIAALKAATWDPKSAKDSRLDIPGVTNICPLDAFEYSWEAYIRDLTRDTFRR